MTVQPSAGDTVQTRFARMGDGEFSQSIDLLWKVASDIRDVVKLHAEQHVISPTEALNICGACTAAVLGYAPLPQPESSLSREYAGSSR